MQLLNAQITNPNVSQTAFKSVYPVYHWHKPADKYVPAFDMKNVKRYQKMLTNMLNSRNNCGSSHKISDFLQSAIEYISLWDADYKAIPFVKSFFNYNGGIKTAWNGNVYEIEPCAYLLTGKDAIDFDKKYCRPIGYANNMAKQCDNKPLCQKEIKGARKLYGNGGAVYIKSLLGKFKDKESQKPLELHTIIAGEPNKRTQKMIKLRFFPIKGDENPLVTNGFWSN